VPFGTPGTLYDCGLDMDVSLTAKIPLLPYTPTYNGTVDDTVPGNVTVPETVLPPLEGPMVTGPTTLDGPLSVVPTSAVILKK